MPNLSLPPAASTRCWSPTSTPTALAFMAPRTLEPVAVSQLTVWGLRGLTALDPDLVTELRDGKLQPRRARPRRCLSRSPPAEDDVNGWADDGGGAVHRGGGRFGAGSPRRHAGHRAELLRRAVQPSRPVFPLRAAARGRRGSRRAARARPARDCVWSGGVRSSRSRRRSRTALARIAGIRPGDTILAVDGQSTQGRDARTVERADRRAGRHPRRRSAGAAATAARTPPSWNAPWCRRRRSTRSGSATCCCSQVTAFNRSTDSHLAHAIEQGFAGPHPLRRHRARPARQSRRPAAAGGRPRPTACCRRASSPSPPDAIRRRRGSGARSSGELAENIPVVVMVDGRTASAAEILAAALADRGRGVVIGSSTLGKGLVQTIAPLPDGGELFVTWSRVLAPRGWPIQGLGVLPQVCTSLGQDTLGSQLASLGAGAPADGAGARDPPRRPRAAAPGADPGDPQRLPRRRGARGGSRHGAPADPRPGRLCRGAAAAAGGCRPGVGGQRSRRPRVDPA